MTDNTQSGSDNDRSDLARKRCPKCSEVKLAAAFYIDRSRNSGLAGICKKCESQNGKKYQNNPKRRLYRYKKSATDRGLVFNLTNEVFLQILAKPCHYCASVEGVGIDRVDNTEGYVVDNVQPCCKLCNYMKSTMTDNMFIEKCKQIANNFTNVTRKDTPTEVGTHSNKGVQAELDYILAKHNGELGITWEDPDVVTPDTKQAIVDWHNKQVGSAFTLGYVEAWKVIAGRYANSSNEDSYLYVSDLIRSLENDEGHQMRVIESNKTGKQWLVVEKISEAELNEAIEAERNKLKGEV